jgi:hypothetical protein
MKRSPNQKGANTKSSQRNYIFRILHPHTTYCTAPNPERQESGAWGKYETALACLIMELAMWPLEYFR